MSIESVARDVWTDLSSLREFLCFGLQAMLPRLRTCERLRSFLLRLGGMRIERPSSTLVLDRLSVRPVGALRRIALGSRCFLNTGVRFSCGAGDAEVVIGRGTMVGPGAAFECTNHQLVAGPDFDRPARTAGISVGDGVWIGAGAILLPGVRVGRGSVVAAGSVVARDVEEFTLVAGVPARLLRRLEPEAE